MHLTPRLYHNLVRPRWFTKKYIHDHINTHFIIENKTVLDFGCGTGANSDICCSDHYCGIDLDMKRINFARKLYPNHTFKPFDGKSISMNDHAADIIMIVAVLHHVTNDQIKKFLNEFHRVLKPGGTIIAIEPYLCPKRKFNNWFMKKWDNGEYIRDMDDYLSLFDKQLFDCRVLKKFRKCLLYNELFFTAIPKKTFC